MLGPVDASHIVRTLDYFLREQTRLDTEEWTHVAVLVAEDIRGSRFVNVVEYLTQNMPLKVMEMSALRVGQFVTLKSTVIFDGTAEREGAIEEQKDSTREYWIKKSSAPSIELVERFASVLQKLTSDLRLTYKKQFIGIAIGNRAENFIQFSPKRDFVRVSVNQLGNKGEWEKKISSAGFKLMDSDEGVRFRVFPGQFDQHLDLFTELFGQSYKEWLE